MLRWLALSCSSAVLIACSGGSVSSLASLGSSIRPDAGPSSSAPPPPSGPSGPLQPEPDAGVASLPAGATFFRSTDFAAFQQDEVQVLPNGALALGAVPHAGSELPNAFHGFNYYNGGAYLYGVAISPVHEVKGGFTQVVASFEATTPVGTWVVQKVSTRIAGRWTKEYVLGVWASTT